MGSMVRIRDRVGLVALAVTTVMAAIAYSPAAAAQESPLAGFERLIGGRWVDQDGAWHEIEWGVGEKLVRSRSYFVIDGEPALVSEGSWLWHPEREEIVGFAVATNMPFWLFEYRTRFEGDTMHQDLTTYGEGGGRFRETWVFTDDDHYDWTLWQIADGEETVVFTGRYERSR